MKLDPNTRGLWLSAPGQRENLTVLPITAFKLVITSERTNFGTHLIIHHLLGSAHATFDVWTGPKMLFSSHIPCHGNGWGSFRFRLRKGRKLHLKRTLTVLKYIYQFLIQWATPKNYTCNSILLSLDWKKNITVKPFTHLLFKYCN